MSDRMDIKLNLATAYLQCNKGSTCLGPNHSGVIVMFPRKDSHRQSGGIRYSLHPFNQVKWAGSTVEVRQIAKARIRGCTDRTGSTGRLRGMFSIGESTVYPNTLVT